MQRAMCGLMLAVAMAMVGCQEKRTDPGGVEIVTTITPKVGDVFETFLGSTEIYYDEADFRQDAELAKAKAERRPLTIDTPDLNGRKGWLSYHSKVRILKIDGDGAKVVVEKATKGRTLDSQTEDVVDNPKLDGKIGWILVHDLTNYQ